MVDTLVLERCAVPGCPGGSRRTGVQWDKTINGARYGYDTRIHFACYQRLMRRDQRAADRRARDEEAPRPSPAAVATAAPPQPPLAALPPLPRNGAFDVMSPSEVSQAIRMLWGTPAAALVLTSETQRRNGRDDFRDDGGEER